MVWVSGPKHCSNITVTSSMLLLQDTFFSFHNSYFALTVWTERPKFFTTVLIFLLLHCFSHFLSVFHVSTHSSVLPLYLPWCHANIALHWLQDEKSLPMWAFKGQCCIVPTLLPRFRPLSHSSGCRSKAKEPEHSLWSCSSIQPTQMLAVRLMHSIYAQQ